MPTSYRIDKSLGLVFTTAQGVLTGQDILMHLKSLRENPDFDPSYDQLVDFRDVTEIPISAGKMKAISTHHVFNGRGAVVAEKDIGFGMMRMYEVLSKFEPDQFKVFRNMAEARRWLGLD